MSETTPEIQLLSEIFHDMSGKFIVIQEQNIDLARAMGDRETMIKEQIKMEVMKTAVSMFEHAASRVRHKGKRNE